MTEIRDLHEPFARFLKERQIPFVRARSDRESTIAKGWPDFTLTYQNRCLLVEFKQAKGKLSPDQIDTIARLGEAGVTVHVVRDITKAVELVREWMSCLPMRDEPSAEIDPSSLVLYGAGTYRSDAAGGLTRIRTATPDDERRLRRVG